MATKQIRMRRFCLTSSKSFGDVVAGLEAAVGHPDMNALRRNIGKTKTFTDLEKVINKVIGPSGFVEFTCLTTGWKVSLPRTEVRKR
jgi:hypothetical protein